MSNSHDWCGRYTSCACLPSFRRRSLPCHAFSLQASEDMLAEARQATDGLESRLFESSRRAQEAEAAWEVEREILSQTNESTQAREGRAVFASVR